MTTTEPLLTTTVTGTVYPTVDIGGADDDNGDGSGLTQRGTSAGGARTPSKPLSPPCPLEAPEAKPFPIQALACAVKIRVPKVREPWNMKHTPPRE